MHRPAETQHFTNPKGKLILSSLPIRAGEKRTENQTQWVFLTGLSFKNTVSPKEVTNNFIPTLLKH
jgi:hypothetical protein